MILHATCYDTVWPLWKKLAFRFFFIYIALYILPFNLLEETLSVPWIGDAYTWIMDGMVNFFNRNLFHVKEVLVPMGGSGDTSYGWAQLWMYLFLSAVGSLIWAIIDRKRKNYERADYWICLGARYYLSLTAFLYGIIKIFALQMIFPSLTQMATPLGDLLPMRFSWLFIGYSTPYQVFSGIMEVFVGCLLLFRRTATAGTILAFAVFTNVMMLNLAYDIPVKLFSINLVVICLFLLAHEYRRIHAFFIMNTEAARCNLYDVSFETKRMRIFRVVLKSLFIFLAVGMTGWQTFGWWKDSKKPKTETVLRPGYYDVSYLAGSDSISDAKRWKDMVIEKGNWLNVKMTEPDTSLDTEYGRTWLNYKVDSLHQTVSFRSSQRDSAALYMLHFEVPDSNGFFLRGRIGLDSANLYFARSKHIFPLAEKQFHWLSEGNR